MTTRCLTNLTPVDFAHCNPLHFTLSQTAPWCLCPCSPRQHDTAHLSQGHNGERPSIKVSLGPRTGFYSSAATGSIATIAAVRRPRWQSGLILRLESRRGSRATHFPPRQPEIWTGTILPSLAKVICSAATSAIILRRPHIMFDYAPDGHVQPA